MSNPFERPGPEGRNAERQAKEAEEAVLRDVATQFETHEEYEELLRKMQNNEPLTSTEREALESVKEQQTLH